MKRLGLILLLLLLLPSLSAAQITNRTFDLRRFDQPAQITFFDGPIGVSTTGKPTELGDFNGNGCGDLAITGQNARGGGGHVRIAFDICEEWGKAFDLFTPSPDNPPVVNIWGAGAGDMFGTELYRADFNRDGFDDLVVSAQNADFVAQGRANSGAVYIFFGSADFAMRGTLDLALPQTGILSIYGGGFEDRLGMWVEGGDFDGDGYPDLLIGASQADGLEDARRPNAGEVMILYGGVDMSTRYGSMIDMNKRNMPPDVTLIIGADADDLLGSTVHGADLNNDGIGDVVASAAMWRGSAGVGGLAIGAGDGPANTRFNAGETFIIFGHSGLRGKIIDLAALLGPEGEPLNKSISVVYGAEARDIMGEEIVVGDLNGDGFQDLVVGSLAAPSKGSARPDGGEAWVIYGSSHFEGKMFDLARPGVGVAIYAAEADSKGGDTMLIADLDRDGFDDLFFGMPNADVLGDDGRLRQNAGVLAVLYGAAGGFPTTDGYIDFASLPAALHVDLWLGADEFDMSAYGMSLGDVDGDGYWDIALNGMNGDGPDNRRPDAGEIYVISGALYLQSESNKGTLAVGNLPHLQLGNASENALAEVQSLPPAAANPSPTGANLDGQLLYTINCAGCHGGDAKGLAGIAVALLGSPYLNADLIGDEAALNFIRVGRTADSSYSKMGRAMPASGGNPNLSDGEILAILSYLRRLTN